MKPLLATIAALSAPLMLLPSCTVAAGNGFGHGESDANPDGTGGAALPGSTHTGEAAGQPGSGISTGGPGDRSSSSASATVGDADSEHETTGDDGATTWSPDPISTSGQGDDSSPTGSDPGSTTHDEAGQGIDPRLDPAEQGQLCDTPGSLSECPLTETCRFSTAEFGRCESCDNCGNLNASCTDGTQCDILFSCYSNRCTNFCTLGTYECGPIENCLDVGHATVGVCDPWS